jgi:hypothetical protein
MIFARKTPPDKEKSLMSSHSGPEVSLSESPDLIGDEANGLSENPTIDPKDITALTLAISGIAEGIVRKVLDTRLESLLPPLMEQSIKNLFPECAPPLIAAELPKLADEQLRALLPHLVESALASQQAILKESIEDATRQALPGLMDPIIERLTKGSLESEIQKFLQNSGAEIVEKIAWEVVPSQAEIEVKKEIERLSADV